MIISSETGPDLKKNQQTSKKKKQKQEKTTTNTTTTYLEFIGNPTLKF